MSQNGLTYLNDDLIFKLSEISQNIIIFLFMVGYKSASCSVLPLLTVLYTSLLHNVQVMRMLF